MKWIAIITKKSPSDLKRILIGIDNTFGPMGSGGYQVKEVGNAGDAIVFYFTQLDCAPTETFLAFIAGGTIYATKIAGAIIGALTYEMIEITTKPDTDLPDCIEKYLQKNIEKKTKIKNAVRR